MALSKIYLENFTIFEKMEISLSPGINIFIGENGTGKTHLLKVLYAFCGSKDREHIDVSEIKDYSFFTRLTRCFQLNSLLDLYMNHSDSEPISICISVGKEHRYEFNMYNPQKCIGKWETNSESKNSIIPAVFLPVKDMLTHGGLEKDFADRKLPFDITLIDILNKAGVSVLKKLDNTMCSLLDKIAGIIGGKVIYSNDKYFIDREGSGQLIFGVEAEGYKKLGLIYRLIETGQIKNGSILIWDEPEANINPKLIPHIVDILLELSRYGVQIFLATHDYVFAKYFEVLRKNEKDVQYHSLYRETNTIKAESNWNFRDLQHNAITAAYDKLLHEVFDKRIGD